MDGSAILEAYRIRDELARRCGNDVRRLGRAIREEQKKSGRKFVSPPAKEPSGQGPSAWNAQAGAAETGRKDPCLPIVTASLPR